MFIVLVEENNTGFIVICFCGLVFFLKEYMAAMWVMLSFWLEGKNLLVGGHSWLPQASKMFGSMKEVRSKKKGEDKSVLPLIEAALANKVTREILMF